MLVGSALRYVKFQRLCSFYRNKNLWNARARRASKLTKSVILTLERGNGNHMGRPD